MNAGRPQPRPEDIERVIELGEGNGYAQPWENTRKGPSLLAELAEKTGKDIDTLTPGERIAFHIGWVRGRIRKYEEAGAIDPAEIAHARENEQFYREKLRQILETPPTPPLSPAPTPIPATPLPESHEIPPEAPSFSRYLHKILENPTSPEAINLLNKLKSDSGRLWIDKKKPNGTVTRIWLSLDLTPEEKAKLPAEFIDVVKAKLTPGNLRFRVDEGATSWRTEWEGKKNAIQSFVSKLSAAPKERKRCEELAASLSLGIPDGQRKAFVDLLMTYLAKDGEEKNIWTHVRNACWHTVGWKTQADVQEKLDELNVQSPSYDTAKIRVWEKIEKPEEKAAIQNAMNTKNPVTLHHAGKPSTKWTLESLNGGFYHLTSAAGHLWIREEHLRISLRQTPPLPAFRPRAQGRVTGEGLGEGTFELMAWHTQTNAPKEESVPPVAPPPKPKSRPTPAAPKPSPAAPVKAPPGPKAPPASPKPPAGKGGPPDTTSPAAAPKSPPVAPAPSPAPPAKPAESKESAEVLREREVIAIPDIHGNADALFASLKGAKYVEVTDSSGDWRKGWKLTEAGKKARIVFTGDYFDRGRQNADVAALINELRKRKGEGVSTLFGNHDVMLLRAAWSGSGNAINHLWENDGDTTLEELVGAEEWKKFLSAAFAPCASIKNYMEKVQMAVGKREFAQQYPPLFKNITERLTVLDTLSEQSSAAEKERPKDNKNPDYQEKTEAWRKINDEYHKKAGEMQTWWKSVQIDYEPLLQAYNIRYTLNYKENYDDLCYASGQQAIEKADPELKNKPRWGLDSLSTLYRWWTQNGHKKYENLCTRYGLKTAPPLQANDTVQECLDRTLTTLKDSVVTGTGPFAEMMRNMRAMAQVDDTLYIHAGLSEEWIDLFCDKGADGVNAHFRSLLQNPVRLANMAGGADPESAIVWSRDLFSFLKNNPDLAQKLKEKGVNMIVCGHTVQGDKQIHCEVPPGIHIIYGDTGMGIGGGSFVRTSGRTSPKNGHVEGYIGSRTDQWNKYPEQLIPLATLPPGKEKPTMPARS